MPPSPKPYIGKLVAGVHGGIDYAELEKLGVEPDKVVDFSVCTNPFVPPPYARKALQHAKLECYPDSRSTVLRRALAAYSGVEEGNVLVSSGSTDLIRMAALAYTGPGDTVVIPQPAYGDYEIACRLSGASVVDRPRAGGNDLQLDLPEIVSVLKRRQPRLLFLCNPNNPTGQYFSRQDVESVLGASLETLVVLDEAYASFVAERWSSEALLDRRNLLVVRSMTKDYALAGLRLGYALAHQPIIHVLERVQSPWSVSSAAQSAGLAALEAAGYLEKCRRRIKKAKGFLIRELKLLGLRPLPSAANFFLVRVGNATQFRRGLLRCGFLVRDCASFGLPEYIRLGVRTVPECRKLIEAIKSSGVLKQ
ncbi:MAG: histidinol-phosphate transaminase [Chloroflexota bacterium]